MSSISKVDVCELALIIAAIGAINWYTSCIMDFNLISKVAGAQHQKQILNKTERVLYTVVGIAGAIVLYCFFDNKIKVSE